MDHTTWQGMCYRRSTDKERDLGAVMLITSLLHRFFSAAQNRCLSPPPRITRGRGSQPSQTGSERSDGAAPWPSSEPLTTYSASASLMWHVRHSGTPATTPEKKGGGERGKGRRRVHSYLNILEGGKKRKVEGKWEYTSRRGVKQRISAGTTEPLMMTTTTTNATTTMNGAKD